MRQRNDPARREGGDAGAKLPPAFGLADGGAEAGQRAFSLADGGAEAGQRAHSS